MDAKNYTTITVRIPRGMRDRIKSDARSQDLTCSQLIRRHLAASYPADPCALSRKGGRA